MSLPQGTVNIPSPQKPPRYIERIEDLPFDLIGRILEFLSVDDCLQVESCSDWGRKQIDRHFATFGDASIVRAESSRSDHHGHCSGCCQCPDNVFDGSPSSMLFMRFFVWIGSSSSSKSYDCYWKGHVLHTSSELLITREIQDALLDKSPAFQELHQVLTKESNQQHIIDKANTPQLDEVMTRLRRSLCIRVIAVYPCQALVMAATPESRHLQIHWDDTSYNSFYQNKPDAYWDTLIRAGKHDKSKKAACMHVWFRLYADKPVELAFIRVDRCRST